MEKGPEKNNHILKIAITGTESTGKSMLAEQLAKHFSTTWVPEYAREYIDKLGRNYEQHDILKIAKGQLQHEMQALKKANRFLFCDTEFLVIKIWRENAYKNCDPWILDQFENHLYDLYLLMDIDLPWEYDPQREHPHMREYFFNFYLNELSLNKLPFKIISGIGELRLTNSIRIIKDFFNL